MAIWHSRTDSKYGKWLQLLEGCYPAYHLPEADGFSTLPSEGYEIRPRVTGDHGGEIMLCLRFMNCVPSTLPRPFDERKTPCLPISDCIAY